MLRKAFVSITLCAVFLLSPFVGLKVNALSADSISAPSAVLMESSTGKVLFEKNPHEQRPCASITKVMTLLLVFEAVDSGKLSLDDEITVSEHAAGMGGSDIWLEKGEKGGRKLEAKAGNGMFVALMLFVGIPLPGTGAWTGTLAASILDLGFKKSVIAVMCGVVIAGIIMGIGSVLVANGINFIFAP